MFNSPLKRLDPVIPGIGDVNPIQPVDPDASWSSELVVTAAGVVKLKKEPPIALEDPHRVLRPNEVNPTRTVYRKTQRKLHRLRINAGKEIPREIEHLNTVVLGVQYK